MAQRNRDYLKQKFQNGERPSGPDFADVFDSCLNFVDDGLIIDEEGNLELPQGLVLGSSSLNRAGALKFENGKIQYYEGGWKPLSGGGGGGGGAFQPIGTTGAVAYTGGNVRIGDDSSQPEPRFRLDVPLGNSNDGPQERVRLGSLVCCNSPQDDAYLFHLTKASGRGINANDFGLRLGPDGDVGINIANGQTFEIFQGGDTNQRLAVNDDRVVIGNTIFGIGPGNDAYFYHQEKNKQTALSEEGFGDFALRLGPDGNVDINASEGQSIRFLQNGVLHFEINDKGKVIIRSGGSGVSLEATKHKLQVFDSVYIGGRTGSEDQDPTALYVKGNLRVTEEAYKLDGANWSELSDKRVKDNIRDLDLGLDQIREVRPVRYRYNGKASTPADQAGIGIVGQEIEAVLPETIQHRTKPADLEGDAPLRIYNGSALTYVLVNAVKELDETVEKLKRRVIQLEAELGDR
jgi:hypothetical protein